MPIEAVSEVEVQNLTPETDEGGSLALVTTPVSEQDNCPRCGRNLEERRWRMSPASVLQLVMCRSKKCSYTTTYTSEGVC